VVGGLLHHGSGPLYTILLDPDFTAKFADFAARVAERYPWIATWTPVNEPLTTARFSGLYGHWYPHHRSNASMLRALVNECAGTRAAMAAIRAVNPDAQLLQTEDLGKTFATAPLQYQADLENERRWLSFDLLSGRIAPGHSWWQRMVDSGIGAEELAAFADGAGRPDLLGINHYLTSERFLDHRLHLYDAEPGGNERDRYHDMEAVRVAEYQADTGLGPRLREAWERYRIPIIVSEVHHGCSRDEQLRWFAEVWDTAAAQRRIGVDVRAVTLWSLFGNVDWRSLLTRRDGVYDVGVFDARSPEPRPTVIAAAAKAYAKGESFDHPVLDTPGWWRRPQRLYDWHGPCQTLGSEGRKLLITGATGTLGRALARTCEHRGLPFCLTSRDDLDIADPQSIVAAIERFEPWAIVNAAGFVRVADAEQERDACMAANGEAVRHLAQVAAAADLPLVTFSSDLVFDGQGGRAYRESDRLAPANVYGLSKAAAEAHAAALAPGQALVIRTSAFFGPWDRHNFAWHVLSALAKGQKVHASATSIVSPTYVPDLCHATLDLLIDGERGIWHVANPGSVSWYDFAVQLAKRAGLDASLIVADPGEPALTTLTSERGILLRPLERAIDEYVEQVRDQLELKSRVAIAA
jgi:dTDP-4-dehydrorhamnose reductase